jgi:hypothetical protein
VAGTLEVVAPGDVVLVNAGPMSLVSTLTPALHPQISVSTMTANIFASAELRIFLPIVSFKHLNLSRLYDHTSI